MANGSRHDMYFFAETAYGADETDPAMQKLRITGTTLGLSRDSLVSEEIVSTRGISDMRLSGDTVSGDINFEMSYASFDDLLRGALVSADWASSEDTGVTTLSATATGYSRAAGSFITDGFFVGQSVIASGFAGPGYNGASVVTAVTATDLTTTPVGTGAHGVEAGGGDEQIVGAQRIQSGVDRTSFTFVRDFADLESGSRYHVFKGCEITSISFAISASQMITGTMSVIGQSQALAADLSQFGTPTFPAKSGTAPVDAFTGGLVEGGAAISVVTELSLQLENGLESAFVVGSRQSLRPTINDCNVTGTASVFFEDDTMLAKFLNETESSIQFNMPDQAGNLIRIFVPRLKYTGGQPDVSDTGRIPLSMPFQALEDQDLLTTMIIERVPV